MERNVDKARALRIAWLRLALGMFQRFGAVFSAVLFIKTGINQWSLGSVVGTGVITTVSIILFGAEPFGVLRKYTENEPSTQDPPMLQRTEDPAASQSRTLIAEPVEKLAHEGRGKKHAV